MDQLLVDFFALLDDLVKEPWKWHKKRELLLEAASERDKTNLEEFISWFDESGKEEEGV